MTPYTATPPADQLTAAQQRELARELAVQLARTERRIALVEDTLLEEAPAEDLLEASEEVRVLLQQRTRLRNALTRLTTDQYGRCLTCGTAVPYGRLLLHPDAESCSACRSRSDAVNGAGPMPP